MPKKLSKGFTLIELLIVIAIIGVLSSFAAMSMVNPQKSARDAKRKSDLELIRSGLEIYTADCGSYPPTASVVGNSALTGSCPTLNTYITKVPVDPKTSSSYTYTRVTTSTYTLCATLELPAGNYCVRNP